jgi:vanillate monooxygenase ferredoxin subunit
MTMRQVRVADIRDEAEEIRSFRLVADDGGPLPAFTPGAHIDVHLATGLVRQYSLCNGPTETDHYLIAVKREAQSRGGSAHMHAAVSHGDRLTIDAPRNTFPLAAEARRQLLFAAGIGVTPLLSMARHLGHAGGDYALHYFTRSERGTAFRAMLDAAPYRERTRFHVGVAPDALATQLPELLRAHEPGDHLYVCGPVPFMDLVRASAAATGWPQERVHLEYFGAAPSLGDGETFEVELAQSGSVITVERGQTLLQALRGAGITIESSCEQGTCGTCATAVLKGEPDHRDQFLSDDQKDENMIIMPCVSRAKGRRLVLDL